MPQRLRRKSVEPVFMATLIPPKHRMAFQWHALELHKHGEPTQQDSPRTKFAHIDTQNNNTHPSHCHCLHPYLNMYAHVYMIHI